MAAITASQIRDARLDPKVKARLRCALSARAGASTPPSYPRRTGGGVTAGKTGGGPHGGMVISVTDPTPANYIVPAPAH